MIIMLYIIKYTYISLHIINIKLIKIHLIFEKYVLFDIFNKIVRILSVIIIIAMSRYLSVNQVNLDILRTCIYIDVHKFHKWKICTFHDYDYITGCRCNSFFLDVPSDFHYGLRTRLFPRFINIRWHNLVKHMSAIRERNDGARSG